MANWYVSSAGWAALPKWAVATSYSVGDIVQPKTAPSATAQRSFRCTTAGLSAAVTEPTWPTTQGGTFTENSGTTNVPIWTEVTGLEARNTTTFAAPAGNFRTIVVSGWAAAGDIIFVDAAHAETVTGALTIAFPGTTTNPNKIICIASTHSNTPVAADITTMGSNYATASGSGNQITLTGSYYAYGINFSSGTGGGQASFLMNSNSTDVQIYDTCIIRLNSTNSGASVFSLALGNSSAVSSAPSYIEFRNVTLNFGGSAGQIQVRATEFQWKGGSLTGTKLVQLFGNNSPIAVMGPVVVADVDLTLLTTSAFLANLTNLIANCHLKFNNCSLATNLGGVITGTSAAPYGGTVDLIVTDSTANVIVREEHYQYSGSMVQDTTNFRTGGASDGTTSKAWKVVTLSGAKPVLPFYCPDIFQWVNSTGSKTISVYCANNSSVTAQDLDMGFEVEYLGAAATPLGTLGSSSAAALGLLSTGTNWGTDTSTWGGSTTTKQVMTKTVTVNQKGWLRVRPFVTKASFTVWIDPLITVA